MKVIGINGSPRKNWHSAQLLDNALAGAKAAGAETTRIDLFDLQFRGCISCFACKRLGGASYTRCAQKDALTPVLDEILEADVLIVAAPIYYGEVPGAVRNFYERLLYPPNHYMDGEDPGYGRRMRVGLIYTMGVTDPAQNGNTIDKDGAKFQRFIGDTETLNVVDTYQFDDYSQYSSSKFDAAAKKVQRERGFPEDCRKAYELGERLAQQH